MTLAFVRGQRGLSLLEFTLFTVIMALLVVFALDRIAAIRVFMERAAVEHNVARIREALAVDFAELVVTNRLHEVSERVVRNPLERFATTNNAGVHRLPAASERQRGVWYYDGAIGNLVYVPRYPEALEWPEGEPGVLRWQVRLDWMDVDQDGQFDRLQDSVHGLELVRLDNARWR